MSIESDPGGRWRLTFWVLDPFNYATPFRAMLARIAQVLGRDAPTDLQLPARAEDEDFVSGILRFGGEPLEVYFEHALGYLALTSDSEPVLHDVARRIQPHVALVS